MSSEIVVLVVDDEVVLAEIVKEGLEDAGYKVLLANNGSRAMGLLDGDSVIAGLVTDINMGGGPDGWAVARHAREINPHLPVVYMTGAAAAEWAVHGVPRSVMVGKPFAIAQIVTAISSLLNAVED